MTTYYHNLIATLEGKSGTRLPIEQMEDIESRGWPSHFSREDIVKIAAMLSIQVVISSSVLFVAEKLLVYVKSDAYRKAIEVVRKPSSSEDEIISACDAMERVDIIVNKRKARHLRQANIATKKAISHCLHSSSPALVKIGEKARDAYHEAGVGYGLEKAAILGVLNTLRWYHGTGNKIARPIRQYLDLYEIDDREQDAMDTIYSAIRWARTLLDVSYINYFLDKASGVVFLHGVTRTQAEDRVTQWFRESIPALTGNDLMNAWLRQLRP